MSSCLKVIVIPPSQATGTLIGKSSAAEAEAGRCVEVQWLEGNWHSVCDKVQENEKPEHFWVIVLSAGRGVMKGSSTHCFPPADNGSVAELPG